MVAQPPLNSRSRLENTRSIRRKRSHPDPDRRATRKEFESFDNIIAGTSTWFDGELPTYWDEFMPEIESIDMTGKKVALFPPGDQRTLSRQFCRWDRAFWRKPLPKAMRS